MHLKHWRSTNGIVHTTNLLTEKTNEVQLLTEWPTPGLWPGSVGRKSLTYSILLFCSDWSDTVVVWWSWSTFASVQVFTTTCMEHFLHAWSDFNCLPSTFSITISWYKIKTRRKAQTTWMSLVIGIKKRDFQLISQQREWERVIHLYCCGVWAFISV